MKTFDFFEIASGDLTKVGTSLLRNTQQVLEEELVELNAFVHAGAADPADEAEVSALLDKVCAELDGRTVIKNLTPHAITFVTDAGNVIKTIEPSGLVARVSAKTERSSTLGGIPTSFTVYGEVVDLPAPEEGVIYVVSSLVASRVPERDDVYIPAESVRDSAGRIVGCKSLGRI